MNTAALDALLDHAHRHGHDVHWADRGPRYGERRWIVTLVRYDKARHPHARGASLDDAARALCIDLEIIIHAETAA